MRQYRQTEFVKNISQMISYYIRASWNKYGKENCTNGCTWKERSGIICQKTRISKLQVYCEDLIEEDAPYIWERRMLYDVRSW